MKKSKNQMFNHHFKHEVDIETTLRTDVKFDWRIPLFPDSTNDLKKTRRANRYLKHQDIKISKMIRDEEGSKAESHYVGMIRTSKSLQVYAFNRYLKGGYFNRSIFQIRSFGKKFLRICKTLPLGSKISRIYIPKKNGKVRPLGVPSVPDRILCSMWAKFISVCHEQTAINTSQHAYTKGKGIHTAGMEIIKLTKEGFQVYEYDFASFFNTIRPSAIYDEILERFNLKNLANYVLNVNINTVPEIELLKVEKEYNVLDNNEILKTGVPQGMPGSGILAIMVLDSVILNAMKTVMYSDDGLIFLKEKMDVEEYLKKDKKGVLSGIKFAKEKCGGIDKKLKFLGAELDLESREFSYGYFRMNADKLTEKRLIEVLADCEYSQKGFDNKWKGSINDNSGLSKIMETPKSVKEPLLGGLLIAGRYIANGITGKDNRGTGRIGMFKTYEYNKTSSIACEGLLKGGLKEFNSERKQRIKKCVQRKPILRKFSENPSPDLSPSIIKIGGEEIKLHHYEPGVYKGRKSPKRLHND